MSRAESTLEFRANDGKEGGMQFNNMLSMLSAITIYQFIEFVALTNKTESNEILQIILDISKIYRAFLNISTRQTDYY